MSEKIYRVQMNSKGMPNFSTAVEIADRPSGEVDAVKEYEHQVHNLNQGYITLGQFDKRIEPLRHLYYDRPQGEWIWSPRDTDGTVSGCCSNCSFSHLFIGGHTAQYNYCPSCGCRMKGADNEV